MPIPRQTDAETKAAECPKIIDGKMKSGGNESIPDLSAMEFK